MVKLAVIALISLSQTGCLLSYLVKSGQEQYKLLSQRQPIEKVLADTSIDENTKHKLALALEVREFAEKELGFKASKNYTTYVDIKRPYVTWVAIASEKNKVEAYQYKFPFIGKLPYKGYFNLDGAKKEVEKFDAAKFDTHVRGVSAYSTLGWFNDPILSSMLKDDDHDLVNLIIHESAHATLFIKSQADFNERLATFLGNLGTELFYQKKEGPESKTLQKIKDENSDEKLFSSFITKEITDLNFWYKNEFEEVKKNKSPELAEQLRLERIEQIKSNFKIQVAPKLKTKSYSRFINAKLNNAVLASLHTYVYDLSDFENLLQNLKGDVKELLKFCKSLENEPDPTQKLKQHLQSKH